MCHIFQLIRPDLQRQLFKQCILILLSPRQGNKNVFILHLWKCNFILRPQFVNTFLNYVSICVSVYLCGVVYVINGNYYFRHQSFQISYHFTFMIL
jgi:hypothetical protein